ncbi:hypothetical protein LNKW23_22690 [Paralimibaculum aggregatum]|uniref:Sulfotransferase family protein n=1 Tax=Paralimibaculum aggregatum TaxID=3036245 RepID=A0ABQ6LIF1_9RHOB|nr:sulfotransferase [Limibaculum sp. NKW23]GMG83056.1 hypothetical protein LNKW23_22690 [Limibaculum sp. NKW23]
MGDWAAAVLAALAFAAALGRAGILGVARGAAATAGAGVEAMLDRSLGEEAQERAVQAAGLALLGASWGLAWRFALCLLAAALPVLPLWALGLADPGRVLALSLGWEFLLGATLVLGAGAWAFGRRAPAAATEATAYPLAERLLHRAAFASPGVLRAAARLDDRLLGRAAGGADSRPPVFVTSLPRAGTTALLAALDRLPGLAAHRYRDMPFLTAPLLWNRARRLLGARISRRERAHGDGLEIDLDTAEAFEEVLWMLHWPEHYGADGIRPWAAADARPEAAADFRRHFAKIVALRADGQGRYLSKNNASIARLGLLPEMFPGAAVVVPLREPSAHAASLLRQHRNFTRLHADDPFAARYMEDIGHLEFGRLHRPIRFPGFDRTEFALGSLTPEDPDYWLRYWIAGFAAVEAAAAAGMPGLVLVDQDDLRAAPGATMRALCAAIGVDAGEADFAGAFRGEPDPRREEGLDPALLAEARALHARLAAQAVR